MIPKRKSLLNHGAIGKLGLANMNSSTLEPLTEIIIEEVTTPAIAATKIAIGIAKVEMVLFLINIKPKQRMTAKKAINTAGLAKLPNSTSVAPEVIKPEFLNPTKQIKAPNAAEIIYLILLGIASIIHLRTGVRDNAKKIIPAKVKRIIACGQVYPAPNAMV